MALDEYFSTGPERERPVFEAVVGHLRTLGPVHVEPVSVGILLKRAGTVAELRPMRDWVALSFALDRRVSHPLMTRKPVGQGGRWWHVVNLRGPDDLDDEVRGWLTEAWTATPD